MRKTTLSLSLAVLFSPVFATTHVHPQAISPLANALRTGIDTNGKPLYLCLGNLFNSTQPGKTWPGYGRCNVPYGGKEYVLNNYTIPNQQQFGRVQWAAGNVQPLVIGKDTNNNPLFLCQSNFNGSMQPGKTWPGYNHCNISYGGREIIMDNYQILGIQSEIIVRSVPIIQQNQGNTHYHR